MSTDLSRTLHATIDGEPAGVPAAFDMRSVRARARRRRTVRVTTRAATGAAAVGVIAFAGLQTTRRDVTPLPPALEGATPGTCGSDVRAVADEHPDDSITLYAGVAQAHEQFGDDQPVPEQSTLGRVAGPEAEVTFGVRHDGAPSLDPVWDTPVDLHLVVTRDGTVVGVADESADTTSGYERDGEVWTFRTVLMPMVTCDEPGRSGGDRLPAGEYEVYAARGDGTPVTELAGPWTLTIVDDTRVAGLPAGFPSDAVPVIPGRVVRAEEHDGVWTVEIATPADDRFLEAARLLGERDYLDMVGVDKIERVVDGWWVEVHDSSRIYGDNETVSYFVGRGPF
jgi:hypothetical protein